MFLLVFKNILVIVIVIMRQLILILYITIISLINNVFILPFILLTLPFTNNILNIWNNLYFMSISGILKYICNISIYVKNVEILNTMFDNSNKSIIIQNHLSNWDFLVIPLLNIKNKLFKIKIKMIALYDGYISLPGIGLFSLLNNNIMLSYNKNKNFKALDECKYNTNDWIYLYPEGNIFCKKSKQSNDNYCKQNNIITTKNCLYPRFGAIKVLNKNNNITNIYSLCTQYDNMVPSNKYHTLLNHNLPKKIFVTINNTVVNDIIEDTINIYRDIDKYLDKEINMNEYIKIDKNLLEFVSLICYLLLFIYNCSLLYSNYLYSVYLLSVIIIYYTYIFYLI